MEAGFSFVFFLHFLFLGVRVMDGRMGRSSATDHFECAGGKGGGNFLSHNSLHWRGGRNILCSYFAAENQCFAPKLVTLLYIAPAKASVTFFGGIREAGALYCVPTSLP